MVNVIQFIDIVEAKKNVHDEIRRSNIDFSEVSEINFTSNDDLEVQIQQNNLFCSTKVYIIKGSDFLTNAASFEKSHSLINLISKLSSELTFYILIEKKPLTNQKFKALTSKFKFVAAKTLDDKEKTVLVNQYLKEHNLFLDKEVYTQLISNLNCSHGNIRNEILKLSLLKKTNVTNEVLKDSISHYTDENIFLLLENILLKNHNKVWVIYNDLILKKNDEINIINAIASQILNIYYVIKLSKECVNSSNVAQITGVSPYFVGIYKNKFNSLNVAYIKTIILDIFNLESNIKLSKIDKKIAFKQFILNNSL
ncbi:MAG: DNA polymerase III subunit delta [Mycoplasma sp.]